MADIELMQEEADALIAMEKHCTEEKVYVFPGPGERIAIALASPDKRESFMLDVTRSQLKLTQATYQNRVRQAVILMRLDLDGPPHRNPDDQEVSCPHLHVYREGYGTKWVVPAPDNIYTNTQDLFSTLEAFMQHCNVTQVPNLQLGGLF